LASQVFDWIGRQGHQHSHPQIAGGTPQHCHHRQISLQQSNAIEGSSRLDRLVNWGNARVVYVNDKLRADLAAYMRSVGQRRATQPLFFTEKSAGFSANTLTQWFHWTYKKAGIGGASSHIGRRTFITTLANKGIGVHVLASLAGHRSIAVTQAYIDVNDEMKRAAVELV